MDTVHHFFQTVLLRLSWKTKREGKRRKGIDLEAREGALQVVALAGLDTEATDPPEENNKGGSESAAREQCSPD